MKSFVFILLMAFISCSYCQNVPFYVPTSGLLGWYSFNGNANDESGNGNHGSNSGAQLADDRYGNLLAAYQFNKDSVNVITIASSQSMTNIQNLTLSMWVKIASYARPGYGGYNQYINKWKPGGNYHFIFANNAAGLYFYYSTSGYFQFNSLPQLNQWEHMVISYNWTGNPEDSRCNLYINGEIVESTQVYQPLQPTNCFTEIGSFNNTINNTVDGLMDDIGIWNRALIDSEITGLYLASTGISERRSVKPNIYPNPSHVRIYIDSPYIDQQYTIFDIAGNPVKRGQCSFKSNEIDISSLIPGSYFIKSGEAVGSFIIQQQ